MFDFTRITLFCLEKRLSKHKMTIFSKNFWGEWPLCPPRLRLWTSIFCKLIEFHPEKWFQKQLKSKFKIWKRYISSAFRTWADNVLRIPLSLSEYLFAILLFLSTRRKLNHFTFAANSCKVWLGFLCTAPSLRSVDLLKIDVPLGIFHTPVLSEMFCQMHAANFYK